MATARQAHQRAAAAERPSVASLSSSLTCSLCHGYLIDAVTIVKCLHSFCKSCILKRIKKESSCPVCDLRISMMKLDLHLKKDDVLQNIVYKAVPGLYQREMKRRRDFYSSRSKGDKTTLTPEERGEMDDSSKGRIIFSPDEAISLSLEYKYLSDQMFKSDKLKFEKQDPPFKELPKRYLNCPAAVTIALLQKFLRMKYSIGSKCRVDIYYMNDVLWSKYTLMDIAYIYSWRRDAPLELSFWIWDPSAKQLDQPFTGANVGGSLGPPRLSAPSSTDACEQSKNSSYLSNSVVNTESQCGSQRSKSDNTETDTIKAPKPAFISAPKAKPAEVEPATKHLDKVQSSSAQHEAATCDMPEGTTTQAPQAPVAAQCKAIPSTCENLKADSPELLRCNKEELPAKSVADNGGTTALPSKKSTSEKVSLVEDDNFGCARTSGSYSWKANIAKIVSTLEKCDDDDVEDEQPSKNQRVTAAPAVPAAVTTAMPAPSLVKVKDTTPCSTEKISSTTVTESKVTPVNTAIVNGVGCDTFKSWRRLSTEKHSADEKKQSLNCTSKDTSRETENTKRETPPVKTCVSRAADMAEAKLNAMRAAALTALNKTKSETVPKEVKVTESSPVVSTTSAVHVQNNVNQNSQQLSKPSDVPSVTKEPADATPSEKAVSSSDAAEPVTTTTTTVASTLPTYLTLSRSHPSLFHGTQKKRGRPKLATVNSLNEEIERAHMLASQAALEIQSKPAIPVITSLRIKPILPPSDKAEQKSPKTDSPPKVTDAAHPGDRSDSDEGRRKSKRRKTGNESVLANSKEVSTTSDSPLGSPRNSGTPEKITLRVTRDETCTLKVEKLQRAPATTVPADGLHDSGFCEDVTVDKSPSSCDSKVKEDKVDKRALHHSKQVQEPVKKASEVATPVRRDAAGKNDRAKEKTVVTLKVSQLKDHKEKQLVTTKPGEQRKESRKGKRKSVEDWVKEQNKWISVDKVKCTEDRQGGPPQDQAPKADGSEDPAQKGTTQRRGRKRSNPVKIEKLEAPVEAQQTAKSTPASAVVACATSSKTSEASPARVKASPPSTPKKAVTELIIPKYIPNPATIIPLTVAHARNKRLKETPKTTNAPSSWNNNASKGAFEQQRGDSEKSKFFKEVLNLSMKETSKVPQTPGGSLGKKSDTSASALKGKKGSSSSQIMKVVEKIATSQKSSGRSKTQKLSTQTERADAVPQKECARDKKVSEDRCHASSKDHTRSRLMGKTLVARPASRSHLDRSRHCLLPSSAACPAKSQAENSAKDPSAAPKNASNEGAEMEILPKLNQTGVFRLEFPGTEQQNMEPHPEGASSLPSKAVEEVNSSKKPILFENREDVAESIKNIARIRKTILESQQRRLSRDCSPAVVENGQHEISNDATANDTNCVSSALASKQLSQSSSGRTHVARENHVLTPSGEESTRRPELKQTGPSESPPTDARLENPTVKSVRSAPTKNNSTPPNGPSTVIHIQKFVTASGKQKFALLSSDESRPSSAARIAESPSRSPSPSKRCSARLLLNTARTPPRVPDGRESLTSPDTSSPNAVPYQSLNMLRRSKSTVEPPTHIQCPSPAIKKDEMSGVQSTFEHASHTNIKLIPVKIENTVQHSTHMDHGYSKQDPSLQSCTLKPEQTKSERQSISSSNEPCTEASNLPNARACEHMYRTTVAEIDLFTALSIIETIKGRATVHDIIEDYVTHLGKFFSMLESSDDQTRRLVEEAFHSKRAVLLRLIRLLKKLTTDLSSNQVSQVLALEVLIERFLYRYGHDAVVDDFSLDPQAEEVTTSNHFVSCATLVEPVYSVEDLEEPKFLPAAPSNEVTVTTTLGSQCVGRRGRVRKAKRGTAWKRRLMQVLKMNEPLWLLPVVPGLRNTPKTSAMCFGPTVPPEVFDASFARVPHACIPDVQGPTASLLPISDAPSPAPTEHLQLTCYFGSNVCGLARSYLHLVSSNTNGRHAFPLSTPEHILQRTLSHGTNSKSLLPCQLRNPTGSQFEQTMIAAICKLLRGDGVCDDGSTSNIPPGRICMATVESTLVITSSNTKNKLMLSAEVGQRLLRGLLSGMGSLPANNCGLDLESLLTVLAGKMSARRSSLAAAADTDTASCSTPFRDRVSLGQLPPASIAGGSAVRTVSRNSVHSCCGKSGSQEYIQASVSAVASRQAGSGRDGLSKRSLPPSVFKAVKAVCHARNMVAPQPSCPKRIRISAPSRGGTPPNSSRGKALAFGPSRDVRAARIKFGKKMRVSSSNTGVSQREPVVVPASTGGCEAVTSTLVDNSVGPLCQAAPVKRPAQGSAAPVLPPAKRPLNSSHIPAGKRDRRVTTLLRSPPCVVPRNRLVLLRCLDPAEQKRRRRAAGQVKPKPKPPQPHTPISPSQLGYLLVNMYHK
ncbi:uncharacterized protein LOC135397092 [Ornithodoros turicata]|uniref:uncharacterized protein LOC135397092 n=1 Tax=Ornithodoros turicata TaxID=34597 RepID=UPI0031386808